MKPEDIVRYWTVSDVRLHPDGVRMVFATSQADLDDDGYVRQLWLWDGAAARRLTNGPSDTAPQWSPDGRHVAFLRRAATSGPGAQVAVLPIDGGEPWIATAFPLGAESFSWAPDSRRLVAVGVSWADGRTDISAEERQRRPRRIVRIPAYAEGRGWTHDRRRHLYLIHIDGSHEPECVTEGDHDEGAPAWRPDGGAVAFVSERHERRGLEPGADVLELDLGSRKVRTVVAHGAWQRVAYRPDGVLHAVGQPDPWSHPSIDAVWRVEADGALTDLTGHLDRSVTPKAPTSSPAGPIWVGEDFLVTLEDSGRISAVRVDPQGASKIVVGGDRCVTGIDANADGSVVAFGAVSPTDPGEVCRWENGQEGVLTSINDDFRRNVKLFEPRAFTVESGGYDIDVWLYVPDGQEQLPLLMSIHGGPASQYGYRFFDEFQVYAGAGYGVVACNPRGSSGRGVDFARQIMGDAWGTIDVEDITAVVAGALAREPRLDPDRQGVMGGSYGGFLTGWLIGHAGHWRSAVIERALTAWDSLGGTSDVGAYFSRIYLGADLPDDVQRLWERSPLSVAHRVTTPTLVIHAENDARCRIEQAERYFSALVRAGVTAELLRFPDADHGLSRTGKPRHRVERFEAILDWHGRHLAGPSENAGEQ